MMKFRTRLILPLISLIVLVLISLGLLLGQLFKSYYLSTFSDRLHKETKVIAEQINANGGLSNVKEKLLKHWSRTLKVHITLVNEKDAIIYDSGETVHTDFEAHEQVVDEIIRKSSFPKRLKEPILADDVQYYLEPVKSSSSDGKEGLLIVSTEIDELTYIYKQIWVILLISFGLSLLLIILLGAKITNRYTKPIEAATEVAMELAKGNYRARIHESPPDEIGTLNTSINILARNLQELFQSQEVHQNRLMTLVENMGSGLLLIDDRGFVLMINKAYRELFRVSEKNILTKRYHEALEHPEIIEIVEQVFMTEQKVRKELILPLAIERRQFEIHGVPIIGTNDDWKGILIVFHDITELKKLESMRKDFVANVSHELKTPITSIRGFTETLLDGAIHDQEALISFLQIILKESERMQTLIKDLLDLSKIEQNGFELNIEHVYLRPIILDIIDTLNNQMEEKNITYTMKVDSHLYVEGDPYRLNQVFMNLINNAIVYTQSGGKINIDAHESEKEIIVNVKDNGIGISPEEIPRIFERFYRVDKARSRNSGGTGLGLAIVKHIIEAHGGIIIVTSEVDKGTTFTIKFKKHRNNK
ncbi:two-component system phosphate regulon sensor histidine kinase PhoR [Oikeobacillus pervagus]|uniref:histidine kinase n=1 Tax=Oikeobacillus pervagus TaxID=1325931 RepID=A0AAJ1SY81_9BACI|nr:ATP-binding protein [Oikeobacillus pervagus]MDQ0214973.1 two-component system phosphate regulon sensor histidine kinase PhoR [Oikeobacillus pervagus]